MKIKLIKRKREWIARLEYDHVIYQGHSKNKLKALKTAFNLFMTLNHSV